MIQRIVKMKFDVGLVNSFKEMFEGVKHKIINFQGCEHLELLEDTSDPTILFTYSLWQSEEDLNRYRNSELFRKTWKQTKTYFRDRPEAWSTSQISTCKKH